MFSYYFFTLCGFSNLGGVKFNDSINKKEEKDFFFNNQLDEESLLNYCSYSLEIDINAIKEIYEKKDKNQLIYKYIEIVSEFYFYIENNKNQQIYKINLNDKLIDNYILNIKYIRSKISPQISKNYLSINTHLNSKKKKDVDLSLYSINLDNLLCTYQRKNLLEFSSIDIVDFLINKDLALNPKIHHQINKRISKLQSNIEDILNGKNSKQKFDPLVFIFKTLYEQTNHQPLKENINEFISIIPRNMKEIFFNWNKDRTKHILTMMTVNFYRDFNTILSIKDSYLSVAMENFYINYVIDQYIMSNLVRAIDLSLTEDLKSNDVELQQFYKLYISPLRYHPTLWSRSLLYFRTILLTKYLTDLVKNKKVSTELEKMEILSNTQMFNIFVFPIFDKNSLAKYPEVKKLKEDYENAISKTNLTSIEFMLKKIGIQTGKLFTQMNSQNLLTKEQNNYLENIYLGCPFKISYPLLIETMYTIFSVHTNADRTNFEYKLSESDQYSKLLKYFQENNENIIKELIPTYIKLISNLNQGLTKNNFKEIEIAIQEIILFNRYGVLNNILKKI